MSSVVLQSLPADAHNRRCKRPCTMEALYATSTHVRRIKVLQRTARGGAAKRGALIVVEHAEGLIVGVIEQYLLHLCMYICSVHIRLIPHPLTVCIA